jgi:hypothetical protein
VLLNAYFYRSSCFADVTSATIKSDAVHTLLRLLGISNRPSFHQCPTECMLSLENDSEIETVPDESEFLGSTVTHGMKTVPWYTLSEEGRFRADGLHRETDPSFVEEDAPFRDT